MGTRIHLRAAWAQAFAALALFAACSAAQAQISLTTVVELAQQKSTSVRLAEADVQKAQAALAQSRDVYIPNLTIGSTIGASVGFPAGQPSIANANMQSLVFSFSQLRYTRAAQAGLEAAQLSLKDAREQVALDASTAYIELDTIHSELEAARQQEDFSARLVEIEQQRTEAGVDPASQLMQAQLTAAQLKLKRLHMETRAATLVKQLAAFTGLPADSILPDHVSIPEIPAVTADEAPRLTAGVESSQKLSDSKLLEAKGDDLQGRRPQIGFGAIYNLDSNKLNNYSQYYRNFTPNNFSFGFDLKFPIYDIGLRAHSRQTAAESLRARVEAEDAQRQNEIQIATLTNSLRELNIEAEIARLKQQIAAEQTKSVLAQLELGNGAGSQPGAPAQLGPQAEQQVRIDERQYYIDFQETNFELAHARLTLLRALGHMQDWMDELNTK